MDIGKQTYIVIFVYFTTDAEAASVAGAVQN